MRQPVWAKRMASASTEVAGSARYQNAGTIIFSVLLRGERFRSGKSPFVWKVLCTESSWLGKNVVNIIHRS